MKQNFTVFRDSKILKVAPPLHYLPEHVRAYLTNGMVGRRLEPRVSEEEEETHPNKNKRCVYDSDETSSFEEGQLSTEEERATSLRSRSVTSEESSVVSRRKGRRRSISSYSSSSSSSSGRHRRSRRPRPRQYDFRPRPRHPPPQQPPPPPRVDPKLAFVRPAWMKDNPEKTLEEVERENRMRDQAYKDAKAREMEISRDVLAHRNAAKQVDRIHESNKQRQRQMAGSKKKKR